MKLEVKYWPKGRELLPTGVNTEIDNAIEDALKPLGFERGDSGIDGECRDITFERPNLPREE